jgi:hypothetical protein
MFALFLFRHDTEIFLLKSFLSNQVRIKRAERGLYVEGFVQNYHSVQEMLADERFVLVSSCLIILLHSERTPSPALSTEKISAIPGH